MELQVDAVHQAQRLEFVLAELAGEPAPDLPAELLHALFHESPVEFVVAVHGEGPPQAARSAGSGRWSERTVGPAARMISRAASGCRMRRSEGRRVGTACVSTCRTRWSPSP